MAGEEQQGKSGGLTEILGCGLPHHPADRLLHSRRLDALLRWKVPGSLRRTLIPLRGFRQGDKRSFPAEALRRRGTESVFID